MTAAKKPTAKPKPRVRWNMVEDLFVDGKHVGWIRQAYGTGWDWAVWPAEVCGPLVKAPTRAKARAALLRAVKKARTK